MLIMVRDKTSPEMDSEGCPVWRLLFLFKFRIWCSEDWKEVEEKKNREKE